MIQGTCLCGAVAYEASNSVDFRNCHCSRCRKARGSDYAANMFVRPEDFRWLRGEARVVVYKLPNTQRFGNSFCPTCGSSMPRKVPTRDLIMIPAGSIDGDPGVRPADHIFVGSKAPWHEITDRLPQHREFRPES